MKNLKRIKLLNLMVVMVFTVSTFMGVMQPVHADEAVAVPLYESWRNTRPYYRFYSTDVDQLRLFEASGYTVNWDIPLCYISRMSKRGLLPLYRLYNASNGDRLYTTSMSEKNHAISQLGYVFEYIEGYVVPPKYCHWVPNTVIFNRYYKPEYGERTIAYHPNETEVLYLGNYEGPAFAAWTGPYPLNLPVSLEPATNLRATDSGNGITLRWDRGRLKNDERIEIQRKPSGGNYSVLQTISNDTNTYTDTTVQNGRTYYYRIKIRGYFADSGYSNEASASHTDSGSVFVFPPNAPSHLYVEENGGLLKLTWRDNSSDENGFSIYVKEGDNDTYEEYAITGPNTTFKYFTDFNPGRDKTYYFKVRAFIGPIYSDFTSESIGVIIGRPTELEADAVSETQINVKWKDNSQSEVGYRIERMSPGEPYTEIGHVGPNQTMFSDNTTLKNVLYYYRVRAEGIFGRFSDYSKADGAIIAQQSGSLDMLKPLITIPSGLALMLPAAPDITEVSVSSSSCSISWNDNSNNESGFRLERKTEGGNYSVIAENIPADTNSYLDTNLISDTVYYYRLLAYNSAGESDYTNEIIVRTLCGVLGEPSREPEAEEPVKVPDVQLTPQVPKLKVKP